MWTGNSTSLIWKFSKYSRKEFVLERCFTAHQSVACTLLQKHPWHFFMLCFKTYPCSWLKSMIIIFLINFMLKISVVKFFSVKKSRKLCSSEKGFSKLNTSSATSWKCLCTHFDHVTKIKTSLKINSRIIEQSNRLPDHLFFLRLWTEQWVKSELVAY